jgi:hypothetical protein
MMEKRFRTQLLERRLSIILAVAHLFFVIKISLLDYLAGAPLMHLPVLFFVIVSNVILIYIATSLNKAELIVEDDALTIKRFMKKNKNYNFSDIARIQNVQNFYFPYTEVFVIGEKLPVRLYLIDGREELIEIFGIGHNIKH